MRACLKQQCKQCGLSHTSSSHPATIRVISQQQPLRLFGNGSWYPSGCLLSAFSAAACCHWVLFQPQPAATGFFSNSSQQPLGSPFTQQPVCRNTPATTAHPSPPQDLPAHTRRFHHLPKIVLPARYRLHHPSPQPLLCRSPFPTPLPLFPLGAFTPLHHHSYCLLRCLLAGSRWLPRSGPVPTVTVSSAAMTRALVLLFSCGIVKVAKMGASSRPHRDAIVSVLT